jgi:hypothetical protein
VRRQVQNMANGFECHVPWQSASAVLRKEEARRLQAERARECLFTPSSFVTLLRAVLMSTIRGWGRVPGSSHA